MPSAMQRLHARQAPTSTPAGNSPLEQKLLIALVVLVLTAITLIGVLVLLRFRRRAARAAAATTIAADAHGFDPEKHRGHQRNFTISSSTHESMLVYSEKKALEAECARPSSPQVPEIHITFPEEMDEAGKRTSGRVVVVRMSDATIGMEPIYDAPPAYGAGGRFQSLDLERIGGLKEMSR